MSQKVLSGASSRSPLSLLLTFILGVRLVLSDCTRGFCAEEVAVSGSRVGKGGNDTGIVGLASSHLGDPRGKRRLLPSNIQLNPREQL